MVKQGYEKHHTFFVIIHNIMVDERKNRFGGDVVGG